MEVHWIKPEDAIELNRQLILSLTPKEPIGVRDNGSLASALQRGNQTRYYNQGSDIFDMAAAVGIGIVQNHPFFNANKRTAFTVTVTLLLINGYWLSVSQSSAVRMFAALAKKEKTESCLAAWLRVNCSLSENF